MGSVGDVQARVVVVRLHIADLRASHKAGDADEGLAAAAANSVNRRYSLVAMNGPVRRVRATPGSADGSYKAVGAPAEAASIVGVSGGSGRRWAPVLDRRG